jgi:hypothetical protein
MRNIVIENAVDVELLYKRHKHAIILLVNVDINFVMAVGVDGLGMAIIVLLQEIIIKCLM